MPYGEGGGAESGNPAKHIAPFAALDGKRPQRRAALGAVLRVGSGFCSGYHEASIQMVFSSVYWSWAQIDLSRPPKPDSL